MSIKKLYDNPELAYNPDAARQIRFKGNESDKLQDTYKAYSVNDQASLRDSALHKEGPFEGPTDFGYSVDGTPIASKLGLQNDLYDAVAQLKSNIASNTVINGLAGSGHEQRYTPKGGYITAAVDELINSFEDNSQFLDEDNS